MAIYHLSAKVISRADGRSAVAAAAYRAASELHDVRLGRSHDFTNKAGVIHSEILLPEGAPVRLADRATLWNEVEATERRKDAQLAREIEIALPRELTKAQAIELARDFVSEQFVARGMVADLNVHWGRTASGEDQPHAHVMLTMREVGPGGFGKKVRDWNRTEVLVGWRERWAQLANERLAELGHDLRIDHRSFAAQSIELEPQNKIGPAGARREARGEDAERAAEHQEVARRNGERIIADPSVVLAALTRQQSTFTRRDLARLVDRHTADADQFTAALAKVEAAPELVRLGRDGAGQERFTTREMLAAEQRMEQAAASLAERQAHRVDLRRRLQESTTLGREQALAYRHVTRAQDLSVVVGYAGTGKSTMLGEARAAWEAEGYRVRGAALSGIAAQQLEAGAGIASRTVHSLLFQWEQGRETLSTRDVLVVDEAGMTGSRQMERLLSAAQSAGAKVVLVGDPEQLQAIEAGAAFRAIAERVGAVEITEVRRQHDEWQQDATRELATKQTEAALARYERAGMVHGHARLSEAKDAMVTGWDAARRERPEARQIMLAYRRDDVRDLNLRARAVRQAAGELGTDWQVATERGARAFAVGERVYFLRNERGLGVKNGTLGTVERIEGHVPGRGERLVVRVDDGPVVGFDVKDYAQIDHGYAATVHKSQGVTVDRSHVLATSHMDRHAAYVGLTRHRERVDVHWSADELGNRERLVRALGRERLKDTSLDYGEGAERAYAERRGLVPESEIVLRERQAKPPAQRWLVPPYVSHDGRDSQGRGLDPTSIARVVAADARVKEAKAEPWHYLERAYRNPYAAHERMEDLIRTEGLDAAARRIASEPGFLGRLRGRSGMLAGHMAQLDRAGALSAARSVGDSLSRIVEAQQRAEQEYRASVTAQLDRDKGGVPKLSAEAASVLEAVHAAAGIGTHARERTYWEELQSRADTRNRPAIVKAWEEGLRNPAVAAEIEQFEQAARQRLGEEGVAAALGSAYRGGDFSVPGVEPEHMPALRQVARGLAAAQRGRTDHDTQRQLEAFRQRESEQERAQHRRGSGLGR